MITFWRTYEKLDLNGPSSEGDQGGRGDIEAERMDQGIMAKKAVVIGAGQSGRGYTARYLFEKGYEITFIDEKKGTGRIC